MLLECVERIHALHNVTACGVLSIPGAGSGSLSAALASEHVHRTRSVDLATSKCLLTTLRSPWLRFLSGVQYDMDHSRNRRYSMAVDAHNVHVSDVVSTGINWLRALYNDSHPWHSNAWHTRQASAAPRYGASVDGARDGNNFLVPQSDWLRGVRCDMQTVYVVCADVPADWVKLRLLSKTEPHRVNVRNRASRGRDTGDAQWARARIERDLYWWDTQLWRWVCGTPK